MPPAVEDIDAFRRDGFVVLRGVLPDRAVEILAGIVAGHRAAHGAGDTGYGSVDSGVSRDLFSSAPAAAAWLDSHRFAAIAARLLGAPRARPVRDRLFLKAPGVGERTMWHQDTPLTREATAPLVVLWTLLTAGGPENAPLRVAVGSHRGEVVLESGLAHFRSLIGPGTTLLDATEIEERFEVATVPAVRGDVVALDGLVLHASLPNHSPVERLAYAVRYVVEADGR